MAEAIPVNGEAVPVPVAMNGSFGGTEATPATPEQVAQYLSSAVPLLLGGSTAAVASAARRDADAEAIRLFTLDSHMDCLIVVRRVPVIKGSDEDDVQPPPSEDAGPPPPEFLFTVSHDDLTVAKGATAVVFTKRSASLANADLASQIGVIKFTSGDPFKALHSVIEKAFAPFLKTAVDTLEARDNIGVKTMETSVERIKFSLLNLEQDVDIRPVTLAPNPVIEAAVREAEEDGRTPSILDLGAKAREPAFLDSLEQQVARWTREIYNLASLDRNPSKGTAKQEITFWINLERELQNVQSRINDPDVQLTLDVLKSANRIKAITLFEKDTGLARAIEKVTSYNIIMKDFPLNALLAAQDSHAMMMALIPIFAALRKIRTTMYPTSRALYLIKAISADLRDRLLSVLSSVSLLEISYEAFSAHMLSAKKVLYTWSEEDEKLRKILRDQLDKYPEDDVVVKRVSELKPLQQRLEQIELFRKQHEHLRAVVTRIFKPTYGLDGKERGRPITQEDLQSVKAIEDSYELIKHVPAMDLSEQGEASWHRGREAYEAKIVSVENRVIIRLQAELEETSCAQDMFRVFAKYKALFNTRKQVRSAVREYQSALILRVREDLEKLQDRLHERYESTLNAKMSSTRDLPPLARKIIWGKQIDRQLQIYIERITEVFGVTWDSKKDGRELHDLIEGMRSSLNPRVLVDDWVAQVMERAESLGEPVLKIVVRRGRGRRFELDVNADPYLMSLSKEVRALRNMRMKVPVKIMNMTTKDIYHRGIMLQTAVHAYNASLRKLSGQGDVESLVANYQNRVHAAVEECAKMRWESYQLDSVAHEVVTAINEFCDKVNDAFDYTTELNRLVRDIKNEPFERVAMRSLFDKIQDIVDQLHLKGYVNMVPWVARLDKRIEQKLAYRLRRGVSAWVKALHFYGTDQAGSDDPRDERPPKFEPVNFEILVQNKTISLNPPIEYGREALLRQLERYCSIITGLPRVQPNRYALTLHPVDDELKSTRTYSNLLAHLPGQGKDLLYAYALMGVRQTQLETYMATWHQFQALWDMSTDDILSKIGDDLQRWQSLLEEVNGAKNKIDIQETRKNFGPLWVNYAQAQARVNMKYEVLHKDMLLHYGEKHGTSAEDFHRKLRSNRALLEKMSFKHASTADAIGYISLIQELKQKRAQWGELQKLIKSGERVLKRQRYAFPSEWLYASNIEAEWNSFLSVLKRRDETVQSQLEPLQASVMEEARAVNQRVQQLLEDWEAHRPAGEGITADEALNTIAIYEDRFVKLKDEMTNLMRAKDALDVNIQPNEALNVGFDDMMDQRNSWVELKKVWANLDDLKQTNWQSIQPKKLRGALEDLISQLKNLPAHVREFPSYKFTMDTIKGLIDVNKHVTNLRESPLKDRHWKKLFKIMGGDWPEMKDLTVGRVWDAQLKVYEKEIMAVLSAAQGENSLQEFLKEIKEIWLAFELKLIPFHTKTNLIQNWDELFAQVAEHITQLTAMKGSPFYKTFEEEATTWEDKLFKIRDLFEEWNEVQRRWVYLDGLFSGSADIKQLLPQQTEQFKGISNEFMGKMKVVSSKPMVLDVIGIPKVQESMERLHTLLNQIQKALGDYLEKQRAEFPRFYFVGDDDLLDIIGNSKNVERLQPHFKKMFAGLTSITLDEEHTKVVGVASREGEEVPYASSVQVAGQRINTWLTGLEKEMKVSLGKLLAACTTQVDKFRTQGFSLDPYIQWMDQFQAQLVVLAAQVAWSTACEVALKAAGQGGDAAKQLNAVLKSVIATLDALAGAVLRHQPDVRRKKLEHLITELVHQRDVTRELMTRNLQSPTDFFWVQQMRFYFDQEETNPLEQLSIVMANAKFFYGFEYLGLVDKLVQTPLTDRAFLTLTQALDAVQGGAPFGPAGTGKTESVKALGVQLGRFVLVFNCDEAFDEHAMGRIFIGLCQVGAWGCFDEFNRLEEQQLSAVSQQIENIQMGLRKAALHPGTRAEAEVSGKLITVNPNIACFITMNPGYAGRSNLPDNLKKLFRNLAMTKPDRQLIAQVMLYSQGFRDAEMLSRKVVPLFILCSEQLSAQSHYDFGLRSLKSVLVSSGNIKRERLAQLREALIANGQPVDEDALAKELDEQEVIIQSVSQTMIPKLVSDDIPLLQSLLQDVFPGVEYVPLSMDELKANITNVCAERNYVLSETFMTKMLQLYQVSTINHGLMLVGPAGTGKSCAWQILLEALNRIRKKNNQPPGVAHVLDPKAIIKDELYGSMDINTREWTDGLFTHLVRTVIDNRRGELNRPQWIIFDGDVDPEWVENLNSVLDDNKLLTLPNGERLNLPKNIRVMFEVKDLKHATLATVSRCGMIWFSEDVLTLDMVFERYLSQLRTVPLDQGGAHGLGGAHQPDPELFQVQKRVADLLDPHLKEDGLFGEALQYAKSIKHVMTYSDMRCVNACFAMLNLIPTKINDYNKQYADMPMKPNEVDSYTLKRLVFSMVWALVGDATGDERAKLSDFLRSHCTIDLPDDTNVIDYEVSLPEAEWSHWKLKVPKKELASGKMEGTNVVVPTLDTVRHEDVLYSWLSDHLPIVLCGPPGSGKTMTLFAALRALPEMEVIGLNFSSTTAPDLILKTLLQYCDFNKTPKGIVLAPREVGKWLVIFCDECNLPAADNYDTVRVITFLRQLVEHNGFWHIEDMTWVSLERIQFVGACNPPTDPGRVPIDERLLRHVPIVYVDYPSPESYRMIYGTFMRALVRPYPAITDYGDIMTAAMVDFFTRTQQRFTADMQAHYIYSPREMTRWVKGIGEAMPETNVTKEALIRLWAHEALRLFQDRLVFDDEREWTDKNIDLVAREHFTDADVSTALERPILYSTWLTGSYQKVTLPDLREVVAEKLRLFREDELDVQLVLFDKVLDHMLRIDRIFRQNQGHMLLIGVSGTGKSTLSRFVAYMNQMDVFQVKVHSHYSEVEFDSDLRIVLNRSGPGGEKMVFIIDGDNLNDTAFLERLNTLLANGEVPGLYEGDEYAALMTKCKESAQRQGVALEGNEEIYKWFSGQVMNNLHVVFTMNPSEDGLGDQATASPALFNRCVMDWFGDWPEDGFYQVAEEFLHDMPLDRKDYEPPMDFPREAKRLPQAPTFRDAVTNACVFVHKSVYKANRALGKEQGINTHVTPRHFVEFINQMVSIRIEKSSELEEERNHLETGLAKIRETFDAVGTLQQELEVAGVELARKAQESKEKSVQVSAAHQRAAKSQTEAQALATKLEESQQVAEAAKKEVQKDLDKVAPTEAKALSKVGEIKDTLPKAVKEFGRMANPPEGVRLVISAIVALLTPKAPNKTWKDTLKSVAKDEFMHAVETTTAQNIKSSVAHAVEKAYFGHAKWKVTEVKKAYQKAVGIYEYVNAMVECSLILATSEPKREELAELEEKLDVMSKEYSETQEKLNALEQETHALEEESRQLIRDEERLKAEANKTGEKVERATQLLKSLEHERDSWTKSSQGFEAEIATLVGDALMSGAFMSYAGYFDKVYREYLWQSWRNHLQKAKIPFKGELSIPDYLSTADEKLRWKQHALPEDTLCTENAIMLNRFQRFPLVIDPSGQATDFILNEYKDKKITRTSFLDPGFRKTLEISLRFGTPLLVQDAEHFDALLNPVLNREVKKSAGRVLVCIGEQEIDLSPSFSVILAARNAMHQFPPDVCSRVTMVNFTVTQASLESQCLNQVLRSERPDVDAKRTEQMKLQGEFRVRLLHLRKDLLNTLNKAEGSILDDDRVIANLEKLQTEAAEVQKLVENSDSIMTDIRRSEAQYRPLAHKCAGVYFTLESMHSLHFLYRYSLSFFLELFRYVLSEKDNAHLQGVQNHGERLKIIQHDIFEVVFSRVAPGLLHAHRIPLAMTLAHLQLAQTTDEIPHDEWSYFLKSAIVPGLASDFAFLVPDVITEDQSIAAHQLSKTLAPFAMLANDVRGNQTAFVEWCNSVRPEDTKPKYLSCLSDGGPNASEIVKAFHHLLLLKAFRPDRVPAMCHEFVDLVFGRGFSSSSSHFGDVVQRLIGPQTPVLMCGVSGYDPSTTVVDLSTSLEKHLDQTAVGSSEGEADLLVDRGIKSGSWVMVKNVHLAPKWLVKLEKKIASTPNVNPEFRLFLTSEINPKLPANLIQGSMVFVYEGSAGVKAGLLRTLDTFSPAKVHAPPAERGRVYLLLAWLHAVVQERLRYVPLGWSKKYEFGDSDLRTAADTIDMWIDAAAEGRAHIDPAKIPWSAIRKLVATTIYGGRLDNEIDSRLIASFVETVLVPASFDVGFNFVEADRLSNTAPVVAPEGFKLDQFVTWASQLPASQPPTWLGLPANAEMVLLANQGNQILLNMLPLQSSDHESSLTVDDGKAEAESQQSAIPAWMRTLQKTAAEWKAMLPAKLPTLDRTPEKIKDPLFRYFAREVLIGAGLVKKIQADLADVDAVCEGDMKQTNEIRQLLSELDQGTLPKAWNRYKVPRGISVNAWIVDFARRVKQLQEFAAADSQGKNLRSLRVWLGGLFNPEAWITATRQSVAQSNKWSLEKLVMQLDVRSGDDDVPSDMANSFLIRGLRIDGATCHGDVLELVTVPFTIQHLCVLRWCNEDQMPKRSGPQAELPLYLNTTRSEIILTVFLKPPASGSEGVFYKRGVALLCSSLSGAA